MHIINIFIMKKNFKCIIAIILAIFSFNNIFAQNFVNESLAKIIGTNFITNSTSKSQPDLKLIHTEADDNNEANLYIFNIDEGGFVIVSASKKVRPILAYSFENNFNDDGLGNAEYFINNYNRDIEHAKRYDIETEEAISELWNDLESNNMKYRAITIVDPLIETRWNQDCYYNEYAPYDSWGPCNRAYAGCVACAMSQVMKYWNYPERGKGSHSYNHHEYGTLSADFKEAEYRWEEMPNEVWSQNDAVATLMYHCGVSVDMDYGPDGSGAQSADVETAMRMYFGYTSAKYKERTNYEDEEWIEMLKKELDESRPMYFSGSGSSGGHAIVCDGYDSQNYFHFNMGWSGYGDGFYSIDDVNGFSNNEAIVMDIRPLPINADENGIIYVTPDGEGDGSSWENATSFLHYATSVATDGQTEIWVKAGTYYGDTQNDKGAFPMYKNNRVYGGFRGDESPDFDLDDRDIEANPTILDGNNERRLLFQTDHFMNAFYSLWDGFTIQNGVSGAGGGAYLCSNSRLYNCKFINNRANGFGGAVRIISAKYDNAINKIENCYFENNVGSMGGAIFDMTGSQLINNKFINNTATTKGGALYVYANKTPKIINCVFAQNKAIEGGAIFNRGDISMVNCDIINNHAEEKAGGLLNEKMYNDIYNSVFWNNSVGNQPNQIYGHSTFVNCAIEGGFDGTNIIDLSPTNNGSDDQDYPMFVDPDNNNFDLLDHSSLINRGDKTLNNIPSRDINYNNRIIGWQIDIGAYEFQAHESIFENKIQQIYSIYPNPIDDRLFIEGNDNLNITIYNSIGQIFYSNKVDDAVIIDTDRWLPGIYIININGDSYKIIK